MNNGVSMGDGRFNGPGFKMALQRFVILRWFGSVVGATRQVDLLKIEYKSFCRMSFFPFSLTNVGILLFD